MNPLVKSVGRVWIIDRMHLFVERVVFQMGTEVALTSLSSDYFLKVKGIGLENFI